MLLRVEPSKKLSFPTEEECAPGEANQEQILFFKTSFRRILGMRTGSHKVVPLLQNLKETW